MNVFELDHCCARSDGESLFVLLFVTMFVMIVAVCANDESNRNPCFPLPSLIDQVPGGLCPVDNCYAFDVKFVGIGYLV